MNSHGPPAKRRSTRQRAAVVEILHGADTFLTAQEIHDELRARGSSIGLTTVYRTLQLLADTDRIDILQVAGEARYRRCSESHHHHLVCRDCKRTVEIGSEDVESWANSVARKHNFTAASHVLEVFGVCSDCSSN